MIYMNLLHFRTFNLHCKRPRKRLPVDRSEISHFLAPFWYFGYKNGAFYPFLVYFLTKISQIEMTRLKTAVFNEFL